MFKLDNYQGSTMQCMELWASILPRSPHLLLLYALCHPSTCLSLSEIIFRYIQPLCEVPLGLTYTLLDHLRERNVMLNVMWQPGWEGSLGENGYAYIYIWLSPFAVYVKLSQHCLLIGCSPIQNKKL